MKKKKQYDNNMIFVTAILAALLLLSYGWGFGHMVGMLLFGPVFMVLIVVLVSWLLLALTRQ